MAHVCMVHGCMAHVCMVQGCMAHVCMGVCMAHIDTCGTRVCGVWLTHVYPHWQSRGIGEQIGSMTDEAKRRMGLFAKNFTNRKKKNQTGSDAEARGLLSGEVEEEITFSPLGERSSGEGGMEMGTFMNDAHNKKDK